MTDHWSQHTGEELALALAEAGLIQFGRFQHADGAIWPVALHLRWLPSYPALLHQAAVALAPLLAQVAADRILTTRDAIPLGVALSLHTGMPMTYPRDRGRDLPEAYAIEGAYDVGHPTVLLADVLLDPAQADTITALARRVGLDVGAVLAVLDLGFGARDRLSASGYRVASCIVLRDVLPALEGRGFLPPAMRATVEAWLDRDAG